MIAQGFKNSVLVCTIEKEQISLDQNGYDIDTLVIDGVSHNVSPQPDPALTDVEIAIRGAAENFEKARLAAPKALDRLKGTIHTALVSGGMSSGEATAAGVGLVLLHGPLLAAFEAAGGHPVAAEALYNAIASKPSTDLLLWLTPEILAIFAAALTPGK